MEPGRSSGGDSSTSTGGDAAMRHGRRQFRVTPYVTSFTPRKIGNVPAQYIIRCPSPLSREHPEEAERELLQEDSNSPPVLEHFAAEDQEIGEFQEEEAGTVAAEQPVEVDIEGPLEHSFAMVDEEVVYEDEVEEEATGEHHYGEQGTSRQKPPAVRGGRKEQVDLRTMFPRTYVEHSRRWTYKKHAISNFADGELFYAPNPYKPVPPSRGAPCAAVRMHYAAQRIDSLKFRGQQAVANAAKQRNMESANCEKCNVRFFLPFNHMRSRVSYSETTGRFGLPMAFFNCPMCRHPNQIIDYSIP